MLTCSSCDSGWHTGCLQPPLAAVPAGDWYCPECEAAAAASGGPSSISKQQPVRITVAGQPVAWVEQAKYLGSIFTSDGGLSARGAQPSPAAGSHGVPAAVQTGVAAQMHQARHQNAHLPRHGVLGAAVRWAQLGSHGTAAGGAGGAAAQAAAQHPGSGKLCSGAWRRCRP